MQGTGKVSKGKATFACLLVCFRNLLGVMRKLLVTENKGSFQKAYVAIEQDSQG